MLQRYHRLFQHLGGRLEVERRPERGRGLAVALEELGPHLASLATNAALVLAKEARANPKALGEALAASGLTPGRIVCGPLKRTRRAADIVAASMADAVRTDALSTPMRKRVEPTPPRTAELLPPCCTAMVVSSIDQQ